MNYLKAKLKRRSLHKSIVKWKDALNSYIQPFKQMPSIHDMGSADRITAHELFSHYTADIIKEDVIFTR